MVTTTVIMNGSIFEPMPHDSRADADTYVAQFVEFHGSNAGATVLQLTADAWSLSDRHCIITVTINDDTAIAHLAGEHREFRDLWCDACVEIIATSDTD